MSDFGFFRPNFECSGLSRRNKKKFLATGARIKKIFC